jgi:hypothetical protein
VLHSTCGSTGLLPENDETGAVDGDDLHGTMKNAVFWDVTPRRSC